MRTVVLDTNVLLADPGALFAFPNTEVVIPETVLGELDKLKTSRVDPDLRFRGREVSRMLFDLSEQGSLIGGVDLPDGGQLRVVPFDAEAELPEGLAARNADDRILAVAHQVCANGCESLTVVTNDLNMLLKAQALGLSVERHADGIETSFARRFIIRPFQRYKIPIGILAMAGAMFAAIIAVALWAPNGDSTVAVPAEFRDLLSDQQRQALTYLTKLQESPTDTESLLGLANLYFDLREQSGNLEFARLATGYYERYLEVEPEDVDARTDLAVAYFYQGRTDRAIQEIGRALEENPQHLQANYNLGIIYWHGRGDYAGAYSQFTKVIELGKQGGGPHAELVVKNAETNIAQVRDEAEKAGRPIEEGATF